MLVRTRPENNFVRLAAMHPCGTRIRYTKTRPRDAGQFVFTAVATIRCNQSFLIGTGSIVKRPLAAQILALMVLGLNHLPMWVAHRRRTRRRSAPAQ